MPEQVIELSVDETNRLRQSLGLGPLRTVVASHHHMNDDNDSEDKHVTQATSHQDPQGEASVLELSVAETNALRERLGLRPLTGKSKSSSKSQTTTTESSFSIPEPQKDKEAEERIEKARLARLVQDGIADFAKNYSLESSNDDVLAWVQTMKDNQSNDKHQQAKPSSSNSSSSKPA
jgi:hypothetical protein